MKPLTFDTDMCIYLMEGRYPQVAERLSDVPLDRLALSAIVVAELRFGALKSERPAANLARLDAFIAPFRLLLFDTACATHFAEAKLFLQRRGKLIGPMDLLIAATALANEATVVTNNVKEFSRVPGLRVENWTIPAS
jgi:tRNA(fMet)-specific endonuclease VapC